MTSKGIHYTCVITICRFMVPMIKSFNLSEDVRDVGFYAGFIAAAFPFAQFLTSIFWG